MAKVILKKKIDASTSALSDVKSYARKIWLAGLGAYAKVGQEGSDYFQELIKAGQTVEKKGKKAVTENLKPPTPRSMKPRVKSARSKVASKFSSTRSRRRSTPVWQVP